MLQLGRMGARARWGAVCLLAVACVSCSLLLNTSVGEGLGASCTSSAQCNGGSCDSTVVSEPGAPIPNGNAVCAAPCAGDGDCPTGTTCVTQTDSAGNTSKSCQEPLNIHAIWVGIVAAGEGWTITNNQGLVQAMGQLGYVQSPPGESSFYEDGINPDGVDDVAAAEAAIDAGAQVIIANSLSYKADMLVEAAKHPNVKFMVAEGFAQNGNNLGSYGIHDEQAWYIAGYAAAQTLNPSPSEGGNPARLGVVGSDITPEMVRYINAYLLGARQWDPKAVVEVQWMGFWYDGASAPWIPNPATNATVAKAMPAKVLSEQNIVQRLINSGCGVIGNQADDGLPPRYVEAYDQAAALASGSDAGGVSGIPPTSEYFYSLGNDNQEACHSLGATTPPALNGPLMASCLGGPYINWTALYLQQLEEIHRGVWTVPYMRSAADPDGGPGIAVMGVNEPLILDPSSVTNFQLNVQATNVEMNAALQNNVTRFTTLVATNGPPAVFSGGTAGYNTTGQRDKNNTGAYDAVQSVAPGELISDKEYVTMCWFAEGVVQKQNPLDPASPDVPAHVPDKCINCTGNDPHPNGQYPPPSDPYLLSGDGTAPPYTSSDGGAFAIRYDTCQENQ